MKLTKTMKQAVRRDRAGRPLSTRQRAALRELRRTRQHEHEQDTLGWRENKRVHGPERGLNAYRIKRARWCVERDVLSTDYPSSTTETSRSSAKRFQTLLR